MKFTLHRTQTTETDRFVCIISGDGLLNPIAKALAVRFAGAGYAAARVKAIAYFWDKRSPQHMSRDLQRYMRRRLKRVPTAQFTFVGYSFGAGTLPFALNLLSPRLKEHIEKVILIAPPAQADFKFFFRSWFHKPTEKAKATAPEIQQLSEVKPVLYVYGEDDYVGARAYLKPHKNLEFISLPGGHDLNKDMDGLFFAIMKSSG